MSKVRGYSDIPEGSVVILIRDLPHVRVGAKYIKKFRHRMGAFYQLEDHSHVKSRIISEGEEFFLDHYDWLIVEGSPDWFKPYSEIAKIRNEIKDLDNRLSYLKSLI